MDNELYICENCGRFINPVVSTIWKEEKEGTITFYHKKRCMKCFFILEEWKEERNIDV